MGLMNMKLKYLKENNFGPKDIEWAADWLKIRRVFEKVEELESLFEGFEVGYLRDIQQKTLILNLKKYAWSLKGLILEKYGNIRPTDQELI